MNGSDKKEYNISLVNSGALVWLLFALAFCGAPDLHDKMIEASDVYIQKAKEQSHEAAKR